MIEHALLQILGVSNVSLPLRRYALDQINIIHIEAPKLCNPARPRLRKSSLALYACPTHHNQPAPYARATPSVAQRAKDGGRGGIRTPGTFRFARFQGWSNPTTLPPFRTRSHSRPTPKRGAQTLKKKNTAARRRVNSPVVAGRVPPRACAASHASSRAAPRCAPDCRPAP
jgi:hypothetical protein